MGFEITDCLHSCGASATTAPSLHPSFEKRSPCVFLRPKPLYADSRMQVSGQRYYKPELGRWLFRDPIDDMSFDTRIYSRETLGLDVGWEGSEYAFCENDPARKGPTLTIVHGLLGGRSADHQRRNRSPMRSECRSHLYCYRSN